MCEHEIIVDEGLRTCIKCGTVVGQQFVTRVNHDCIPLYIYSRVVRFDNLLQKNNLHEHREKMCFRFKQLEINWKYIKTNRKYFLNLNLVMYEIARELGIFLPGYPIKDKKRTSKQIKLFKKLADRSEPIVHSSLVHRHLPQQQSFPRPKIVAPDRSLVESVQLDSFAQQDL